MDLGGAVLTFVSVFVAAVLAFYLDGLRERRATASWVREYLGFWRRFLAESSGDRETNERGISRIQAALDAWLAAEDEPDWSDLQAMNVNSAVSFTPLLLSAGAGVVPPELLSKMFAADATAAMVIRNSEGVARLFETQVQPLVLSRVAELSPSERRAVELYREEFGYLCHQMSAFMGQLDEIRAGLERLRV